VTTVEFVTTIEDLW